MVLQVKLQVLLQISELSGDIERIGDHDESDSPDNPSAFDGKNSRSLLEDIDSWLSRTYGRGNILLSYVTREFADPNMDPEADPGFLQPDVTKSFDV